METNEKLSELMQEAVVMVNRTAVEHEDRVKAASNLSQTLQETFEKNGIEAAETRLEVETSAREQRAEAQSTAPANPHL